MTILNLFRGQCIGVKVDVIGDDCLITLDLEDYNRLPPLIPVGAPDGTHSLDQADGTKIWLDPRGGLTGAVQAFTAFADGGYWPDDSPTLDLMTGFLADEVPGTPLIDFTTAMSDLKSFVDAQAPRVSGSLRWWLAPPPSGDGLILYWVDFSVPSQVAQLPAPYAIDSDAPDWTASLLPIHLGPISWDWAGIRGSTYIRGGTPAPEGSGFATGIGNSPTGTAYIDSPGSITADDKMAIGLWHQNRDLVELMTGSATMPSGWDDPDTGDPVSSLPWAVGQTVLVTSARHSRLFGHALDATPAVIQSVKGRLVTPSGGLGIAIDGAELSKPFEWKTLTFESVLGSTGKATVVIHLLGDTDTLVIAKNADVWIALDDTAPADIEWDLQFGDIPAGSLARELAKVEPPPFVPPVYVFIVTVLDPEAVKAGGTSLVRAQLATGPQSPVALGGVPMEWVNPPIQWTDAAQTVPGDLLTLADDTGTTDSAGTVFTTLTAPSGDFSSPLPADYNWTVDAVALPVT